jgi:hypothetical protein
MKTAEEACRYYQKRFRIETFFSDQKSRGFHIHKSHIADPQRLSRLLIAASLAYIWIIYWGTLCEKEGWLTIMHRKDRCDLRLFQLGLRTLEYVLNEDFSLPVMFYIIIETLKSVRWRNSGGSKKALKEEFPVVATVNSRSTNTCP